MICACEGFSMRAQTGIVNAIFCALILGLVISPAFAQGGGHAAPPAHPPAPLPRPDPSNFDRAWLMLESETRNSQGKSGEESICFLPPLNSVHSHPVPVTSLQLSGKAK